MFFRDVLKRVSARPGTVGQQDGDCAGTASCGAEPSLLGELAADPEDFVELASVLGLDLRAVIDVLASDTPPETANELVATLAACRETAAVTAATLGATAASVGSPPSGVTAARGRWSSWGSGGEGGWGRWVRVRGGARTQRDGAETTDRRALVAS